MIYYNIYNKNINIIIIFILILILIIIYNLLIFNNKNININEKFTTETYNIQTIINKFFNKLNKKNYLFNKKINLKDILPECVSDNNVLITEYDNDIIKLSIKNKKYGLISTNQYKQIESCSSSTLKNENTTSFIYNNIIYGNSDKYTNNCSDLEDKEYGRISNRGFSNDKSISDIITNARETTYDDCILFYDETDESKSNSISISESDDIWGNTKLYAPLSHYKSDIIDNLNCHLTNDYIKENKDNDITIKGSVWGNTINHIKTSDISDDNFKECAIKNSDIIGDTYTHSSDLTIIKKDPTLTHINNCSKTNNEWAHIGTNVGEYIKKSTYEHNDCNSHEFDNYPATNTYLQNKALEKEILVTIENTEMAELQQINMKKISLDNYIPNNECLNIDTDKKINSWGDTDYYSISENGLWPNNLQSEIDDCANCNSVDECDFNGIWDKKNIIPSTDCAISINDNNVNKLSDGTNNWYTDNVSISKQDGNRIIYDKLKENYNTGINSSLNDCSIKYSDIYGYTNAHTDNWDIDANKTIREVNNKQIDIIKNYAKEDCLLSYTSFFDDDSNNLEYKYDDDNYYGKIIDYDNDDSSFSSIGYVKNSDTWITDVKNAVRDDDVCIFNDDEINTIISEFPTKVNEKDLISNAEWGKISDTLYYDELVHGSIINHNLDQVNNEYLKKTDFRNLVDSSATNSILKMAHIDASCYQLYNIILETYNKLITDDIIKLKIYELTNIDGIYTIIEPAIADFNLDNIGILSQNLYLKTHTYYKIIPYGGNGWGGGSFTIYGDGFQIPSEPLITSRQNVFSLQPPMAKYLYIYPDKNYPYTPYGWFDATLSFL